MKSDHILFLFCLQGFLLGEKTVIEPSVQVTYAEKLTLPEKKVTENTKTESLPKSHESIPNRKAMVVTGGEARDSYISETTGSGSKPYVYTDALSSETTPTAQQANVQTSNQPSIMIPANHPCYTNCMSSLNSQTNGVQTNGQGLNLNSMNPQNVPIAANQEDSDAIDNFFGKVNRLVSRTGDITGNILYNTAAVGNNAMNMQYQITANSLNQQAQLEAQNQINQENIANGVYSNSPVNNQNQGYYTTSGQTGAGQGYNQYGPVQNSYGTSNGYGNANAYGSSNAYGNMNSYGYANNQAGAYVPSQTVNPTFTGFRVLV